jgi:hypothetical protein
MTTVYEIRCVDKTQRLRAHERINSIGGLNADGTSWSLSVQEAVAGIEKGTWKFYMTFAGRPVWVLVASSNSGHKYLKTEHDGEHPSDLLSLPQCQA